MNENLSNQINSSNLYSKSEKMCLRFGGRREIKAAICLPIKGRQAFLESNPENFSKILHDYSDKKKGFIIWKDLLEGQIA